MLDSDTYCGIMLALSVADDVEFRRHEGNRVYTTYGVY